MATETKTQHQECQAVKKEAKAPVQLYNIFLISLIKLKLFLTFPAI